MNDGCPGGKGPGSAPVHFHHSKFVTGFAGRENVNVTGGDSWQTSVILPELLFFGKSPPREKMLYFNILSSFDFKWT